MNTQFFYDESGVSVSTGDQVQSYPWTWNYTYPTKTAREQVQEEILTKMSEAIKSEDLKRAKELVALAKAIKEL